MKRIIKQSIIILTLALGLMACSNATITKVSDGDETIAQVKGVNITKNDIYKYGKLRFGQNLITVNLIDMQLEKNVSLDADDEKLAKERLEETRKAMGEDFEAIVKASGYKDIDDYYNRFILRDIKNQKLFEQYVADNIETITAGLHTHKIRVLKTKDKANSEAAMAELLEVEQLTGEKFQEIAKKYSQEEIVAPSIIEHVYADRTVNKHYNTYLENAKVGLIEENILVDEGFEIIYVEELDLENDLDMIVSSIEKSDKVNEIVTKAMYAHFSAKGNFEIHDSELYELFKENNPFIVN